MLLNIDYWQSFVKSISDILSLNVKLSLHKAAFGIAPDELGATSTQDHVTAFASLIAFRKILLLWTSPQPPSQHLPI